MKKIHAALRRFGIPILIGIALGMLAGGGAYAIRMYMKMPHTNDPFLLGEYYFNSGNMPSGMYDLKRAAYYYGKAVTEKPETYPLAWYQLARVMFVQGRFYESLRYLDKQEQYFQNKIPNMYYMRGLVYGFLAKETNAEEHWDRAAENFKKFLFYMPDSIFGYIDLSWIYFAQGKYDEMLKVVAPFHDSDNPWIQNMYGLALLNTGKKTEACTVFTKADVRAASLTLHEWGKVYPGNDPVLWEPGLDSFRTAVRANKEKACAPVDNTP